MSEQNLEDMFTQADKPDYEEGLLAYSRYHNLMRSIAQAYGVPFDRVVAAFVATSPNNDYTGNLRSLISLLQGLSRGVSYEEVTVSTYRHCGERAWSYLRGDFAFLDHARGLKIVNFYHNVLKPNDHRFVTIDGHMCAAWEGKSLTMKEAIVKSPARYNEIANATKRLAFRHFILPNQYQAIVWFARKRTLNIKYNAQMHAFTPRDDLWHTARDVRDIKPFPERRSPLEDMIPEPDPHQETWELNLSA